MALTVVSAASVVRPRDEQHALALLREAGDRGAEDELRTLARRVVQGSALIVRTSDDNEAERLDKTQADRAQAPLLTTLMLAAG